MLQLAVLSVSHVMRLWHGMVATPDPSPVPEPGGCCRGSHSWTQPQPDSLQQALVSSPNPAQLYVNMWKLGKEAKIKSGFRFILNSVLGQELLSYICTERRTAVSPGQRNDMEINSKPALDLQQPSKHWFPQRQPDHKGEVGCPGPCCLLLQLNFFFPLSSFRF